MTAYDVVSVLLDGPLTGKTSSSKFNAHLATIIGGSVCGVLLIILLILLVVFLLRRKPARRPTRFTDKVSGFSLMLQQKLIESHIGYHIIYDL